MAGTAADAFRSLTPTVTQIPRIPAGTLLALPPPPEAVLPEPRS